MAASSSASAAWTLLLAACTLLLAACGPAPSSPPTRVDLSPLPLAWPLDPHLSADQVRVGIDWDLSLLGALPPADGAHLSLVEQDGWLVGELDLAQAGFPAPSHAALTDALAELRDSEELALAGAVDPGRLLMLTLHEPWRYYAITGACGSVYGWRTARLVEEPDRYDVVTSLLAGGDRMVLLPPAGTPVADLALAMGTDDIPFGEAWSPTEFEVVDLMDNGQQRFAAYDAHGDLVPHADPDVVPAGQPGRCQWCHEGNLMVGTPDNPSTDAAIPTAEWLSRMAAWQAELEAWRAGMATSVIFADRESHTQGERVVRDFLLPTVARAAAEWGLSEEEARALAQAEGLWLGADEEWPDRGEVLLREEVEAVWEARDGVARVPVLEDAREPAEEEAYRGQEWAGWLPCEG